MEKEEKNQYRETPIQISHNPTGNPVEQTRHKVVPW